MYVCVMLENAIISCTMCKCSLTCPFVMLRNVCMAGHEVSGALHLHIQRAMDETIDGDGS